MLCAQARESQLDGLENSGNQAADALALLHMPREGSTGSQPATFAFVVQVCTRSPWPSLFYSRPLQDKMFKPAAWCNLVWSTGLLPIVCFTRQPDQPGPAACRQEAILC